MVKRLYSTAINCGARAIVICDTAGHATPMGAFALVRFVLEEVVKPSGEKIRVDWHGHCDRGLAIANSMAALMAGASASRLRPGIGGRTRGQHPDGPDAGEPQTPGHPPPGKTSPSSEYCQTVSKATGVRIRRTIRR
jgi:hypothetical protein